MGVLVADLWAFFKSLPALISIYLNIKKTIGEAHTAEFLRDLDESTALVVKSLDPLLPIDEKRKIRRDALEKSRALWGRIVS
jgi:hypothetical protein